MPLKYFLPLPLSAHTVAAKKGLHRRRQAGFSLIELAVVIVVITLLIGSLLVPLATQVDSRRYSETEKQLELIKEALIGYALAKRYLPCPAISATDGNEDRDPSNNDPVTKGCTLVGGNPKREGYIPWAALGVTRYDAWNNLIRYSVDPRFAQSDPDFFFRLNDVGDIRIRSRDEAGTLLDLSNVEIPAVVISHGKNGYGGTASDGGVPLPPAGWAGGDEDGNATGDVTFLSRKRTERTAATGGEFDDVVVWLSQNQLFARMVRAGRMP